MAFRLSVLCASFFTSCETGHKQKERPDLPVSFVLVVLHGLRLECKKSMEPTASSYCSSFVCSIRESRENKALSESVPAEACSDEVPRTLCSNITRSSTATRDAMFCRKQQSLAKFLMCLLDVYCMWRWQFVQGFICEKAKALLISAAKVPTLYRSCKQDI